MTPSEMNKLVGTSTFNDQVLGTCSLCSGPVTVPQTWMGLYPPPPTCQRCGAVKKESYGPVIEMTPRLGFKP